MSVDQSTGSSTDSTDASTRRAGGSHRAERRGPHPMLLLAGVVILVVGGVLAAFLMLGGSDDGDTATPGATSSDAAATTDGETSAGAGQEGSPSDGAASQDVELATQEAAVAPGEALAENVRLELDETERTELQQGRVDLRVLSLLALLGADYDIGVADFAAPDSGDGEHAAYVVDIDSVDGSPVDAAPARDLARVAADQNGVFRPEDVSTLDGVIRIEFAPRDSDELPPVPLP